MAPAPVPDAKARDSRRSRMARRARNIRPRLARQGVESSAPPGRHRRGVERTLAGFARFRRRAIRYERRAGIHQAFPTLVAALIRIEQSRRFGQAL